MAGEKLNLVDGFAETLPEIAGVFDATPPIVTVISPAAGTPIQPEAVLTVEITDAVGIALAPLYAEFPGWPSAEMVYNGAGYLAPYAALSTATPLANNGVRLAIRRSDPGGGGWPGNVSLTCIATDTSGNIVA